MKYKLTYLMAIFLLIIVGCGRENDSQSTINSSSNQKDSEPKHTIISKQFLDCKLKGEITNKYGTDNFDDLVTVEIRKTASFFENEKYIIHSIHIEGNTVPYTIIGGKDFRIDDDEYNAQGKSTVSNDYDTSLSIKRQTGNISYSAANKDRLINASGKCSKVTEKKF